MRYTAAAIQRKPLYNTQAVTRAESHLEYFNFYMFRKKKTCIYLPKKKKHPSDNGLVKNGNGVWVAG